MNWLDLFCDALAAGPAFRRALDAALRPGFVAATGGGPAGWTLVPAAEGVNTVADGASVVATDLVGPDAQGWPVRLYWRVDGVTPPLPSDPRVEAAAAAGRMHAGWQGELPLWVAKAQPLPDTVSLPFAVESRPLPWPDVWLEIELVPGADAAQALPAFVARLLAARERWDAHGPGRIHQLGSQAAVLAPQTLVINVDFGSAPTAALVPMLQTLAAGEPMVRRVIVRSTSREAS